MRGNFPGIPIAGLEPALVRRLKAGYSAADLRQDLVAGLTMGFVALPTAIAFSIGTGATPTQGLQTAIFAGFAIALLGGSYHQVAGPTGVFVVMIADMIRSFGMDGLLLAMLIAGILLCVMGISGLGSVIKFMPYPVTVGFTTGTAIIILAGQVRDLIGLDISWLPLEFTERIRYYLVYAPTADLRTILAGAGTILIILAMRRFAPRLPAAVTAVAIIAAAAWLFHPDIETIGSVYGEIPRVFSGIRLSVPSLQKIRDVFPSALTIAILVSIESLQSAVVADGMTGTRHSASAELVAHGVGNILSAFIGGIPATGAIAKTATNIKAGARSPVAAMTHSLVILAVTLVGGRTLLAIPLTALAAVRIFGALDMIELHRFFNMRRAPKSDLTVMLVTFFLTITVDLSAAVQVGVLLSIILFARRQAETPFIVASRDDDIAAAESSRNPDSESVRSRRIPEGCEVYEINGPLFFGVADMLQDALDRLERPPAAFILRMRHVPTIDATGLNALRSFERHCMRHHTTLILSEVREQPRQAIAKAEIDRDLGAEDLVDSLDAALRRAQSVIEARNAARRDAAR